MEALIFYSAAGPILRKYDRNLSFEGGKGRQAEAILWRFGLRVAHIRSSVRPPLQVAKKYPICFKFDNETALGKGKVKNGAQKDPTEIPKYKHRSNYQG